MKTRKTQAQKFIENWLKDDNITNVISNIASTIKDLSEYPDDNKHQLKFFKKVWLLIPKYI